MSPIPCAHCGTLFMRRDKEEKICNSCFNRENKNKGKEMSKQMSILIQCTPEEHISIEETCINEGKNFSEYLISLHMENIKNRNSDNDYEISKEKGIKAIADKLEKGEEFSSVKNVKGRKK